MSPISDRLDVAIDLAIEYAISTLAAAERLQPVASYEAAGEVRRAFFLGIGNPDPVVEAREWVAAVGDLSCVVLRYPGEVHHKTTGPGKAVLAEAWERGMAATVVIAQEYEQVPDGYPSEGSPLVLANANQLEVGTAPPLWSAP